ncbi:MAG TPA: asparagine synthase (glutamine-hydrolyzing) [Bacteroidales bacterium]|nr:asparagine synthase (glutamine-hydrolyzing) [Bacteroidales bacterium]
MCGITGWWNKNEKIDHELFFTMRDTLIHRGPDGFGSYFSYDDKFALGHRRLSFLDLSDAATQPLSNEDNSIWLTINGEIYNYKELREILETKNHVFKSQTDSEVILHAYEEWGTDMINMLEGMFAFGLWDEKKQKLILARDKFGIKPLYYYLKNEQIIFGSEIKAIVKNPEVHRELNYTAICEYFIYRYIPSPNTIFENIFKIKPAHFIEVDSNLKITATEYFKLSVENQKYSCKKLVKEIDELLRKSVKIHIRSDVPIGSFLSGGYDSSSIVKYFSEFEKGFNTYTIGFEDWENSEHKYAEIVAKKYNTHHHTEILDSTSLDILNDLMYYYDEPIADISIIPTYLVSKLASQHNKAVLSGEGADELFAGYTWHREYLWHITKAQIKDSKKWKWDLPINNFDVDSYSKAMAMGSFDMVELKELLNPELQKYIPKDCSEFYRHYYDESTEVPKRFQIIDIKCFMGELVLPKIDRASMANSLEVRVPFLNSEICNKMLSLKPATYFDKKKQKVVLQKILKKDLPSEIINRKKQGFTGPDKYYMDFDWYRKNLENSQLVSNGIINKTAIDNYLENKDHWRLWKIAVLEKWFKIWIKTEND